MWHGSFGIDDGYTSRFPAAGRDRLEERSKQTFGHVVHPVRVGDQPVRPPVTVLRA
jgi:hypothetical protein